MKLAASPRPVGGRGNALAVAACRNGSIWATFVAPFAKRPLLVVPSHPASASRAADWLAASTTSRTLARAHGRPALRASHRRLLVGWIAPSWHELPSASAKLVPSPWSSSYGPPDKLDPSHRACRRGSRHCATRSGAHAPPIPLSSRLAARIMLLNRESLRSHLSVDAHPKLKHESRGNRHSFVRGPATACFGPDLLLCLPPASARTVTISGSRPRAASRAAQAFANAVSLFSRLITQQVGISANRVPYLPPPTAILRSVSWPHRNSIKSVPPSGTAISTNGASPTKASSHAAEHTRRDRVDGGAWCSRAGARITQKALILLPSTDRQPPPAGSWLGDGAG